MIAAPWSSIVVRQAVLSTTVMLIAICALGLASRILIAAEQHAALLMTIDTDIAGLVDGMASGGPAEVRERILDRTAFAEASGATYDLMAPSGKAIAGNLKGRAVLDAARSEAGEISTPAGVVLARATKLRGGYTLLVGRSLEPSRRLVARETRLFAIAALPAAIASIVFGGVVAQRTQARLQAVNRAFARFQGGERDARTELPLRMDEIGMLAQHVDLHLADANAMLTAQRDISDNIAHELRTPLSHIDARLIKALGSRDRDEVRSSLHGARDDIRAIVSLFDALLDLATAQAAQSASSAVFNLSERLGDLAELYNASAEDAGIAFSMRIEPGVLMRGEPMALSRAVANLLDNGIKYLRAGDHLRLTLAAGPRIIVEDDGPGIAVQDRSRLFERFSGTRTPGQGHGLGLALVRVIAARHGLTARYEDAAPGCRFILAPEEAR